MYIFSKTTGASRTRVCSKWVRHEPAQCKCKSYNSKTVDVSKWKAIKHDQSQKLRKQERKVQVKSLLVTLGNAKLDSDNEASIKSNSER